MRAVLDAKGLRGLAHAKVNHNIGFQVGVELRGARGHGVPYAGGRVAQRARGAEAAVPVGSIHDVSASLPTTGTSIW